MLPPPEHGDAPDQPADPRPPAPPLEPAQTGPSVTEWLTAAGQLLAVTSVVAYGVLRLSYERFYEVFGLSPEDVGVTFTRILSQSGVGVLVLIIGLTVLPLVCLLAMALPVIMVGDWKYAQEEAGLDALGFIPSWLRTTGWGFGLGFGAFAVVGLGQESSVPLLRDVLSQAFGVYLVAAGAVWIIAKLRFRNAGAAGGAEAQWWLRLMNIGLAVIAVVTTTYVILLLRPIVPGDYRSVVGFGLVAVAFTFLWQWAGATAKPAEFRSDQQRLLERWDPSSSFKEIFVGVLALAVAFLLAELPDLAEKAARCGAEGRGAVLNISTPGNALNYGRLVLLGVRAEPVKLDRPPGGSPLAASRRRLLLLGQSEGIFVLWDIDARRTLRVPAGSDVVIRSGPPHASTC
jgi:hypothetical protein